MSQIFTQLENLHSTWEEIPTEEKVEQSVKIITDFAVSYFARSGKKVSIGDNARLGIRKEVEKVRSAFQIDKMIKTGKAPKSIVRFDKGQIFKEKDHIHFSDKSALNIDGTWKHGKKELTNAEKNFLKSNGWNLPN